MGHVPCLGAQQSFSRARGAVSLEQRRRQVYMAGHGRLGPVVFDQALSQDQQKYLTVKKVSNYLCTRLILSYTGIIYMYVHM